MSLPDGPLDISHKFGVDGNFIVINVENLLIDWPTYLVKFTPKNPGPVKLILHLKDASKLTWDQDSDTETPASILELGHSLDSCLERIDRPLVLLVDCLPALYFGVTQTILAQHHDGH
ncbi:uncharacterized protein EDB91DRAFT_1086212 [Suillus paluster]|uniref:uncharacterized protein n=1 Tax=Suillus paluster TaxID=48578 RepID=UPI001B8712E5|nr:uncharacterized protein EDB91DRAFT_1086212 [Suillus paluster]KAG1728047.1 hypothetical protein EDB91DRAFT_1086212 [Suillus paluster]